MAIKRITLSVPMSTATRIKKAAGVLPVSAWVTALIEQRLDDVELESAWATFLRDVAPSPGQLHQADVMFRRLTKRSRKHKAA